jgi:hypothetical protein
MQPIKKKMKPNFEYPELPVKCFINATFCSTCLDMINRGTKLDSQEALKLIAGQNYLPEFSELGKNLRYSRRPAICFEVCWVHMPS